MLAAAIAGVTLCGCATSPPPTPVTHFGELRIGRAADAPEAAPPVSPSPVQTSAKPALRPRMAAPVAPTPVLPVGLNTATARVSAYLAQAGFALEQRPEGAGLLVSATRMGAPQVLAAEAVCGLEALHRPDIASTELTVRLTPAPGGVQVEASARYVEVDTRLISGELARQTCRSRGVLEAAVRRAALAG